VHVHVHVHVVCMCAYVHATTLATHLYEEAHVARPLLEHELARLDLDTRQADARLLAALPPVPSPESPRAGPALRPNRRRGA